MLSEEPADARDRFDVLVRPNARIPGGDAALRRNGRGFGNNQSGAADGAGAQVNEVPIGRRAIV
jgi:hypothetical protein